MTEPQGACTLRGGGVLQGFQRYRTGDVTGLPARLRGQAEWSKGSWAWSGTRGGGCWSRRREVAPALGGIGIGGVAQQGRVCGRWSQVQRSLARGPSKELR